MPRILIVDDEPSICWGLERLGRSMGHRVESASSAEHGLTLAGAIRPDVVLLDVRLPGMDGLTAIDAFRRCIGDVPIIVMTAFGDLSTAVTAVESGVLEFIVKPFDLAEIRAAIERAWQRPALSADMPPSAIAAPGGMVGQSPAMRAVFKRIALAAKSDASVLVSGESGVGKELAARAIHGHSDRRTGPFVVVDAAALDPSSAEAELFGQVAAAGGVHAGVLALAHGGTLLLEGVAALPWALQAKLVRVIEQGELLPIGGTVPVPTRFRLISSTRDNLSARAAAGTFRHDLLLHLATFTIEMPPLRDRGSDVLLLAKWFLYQAGAVEAALTNEAMAELTSRPWLGNVRELRGAIDHARVLARNGPILPTHFPRALHAPASNSLAGDASRSSSLEHAVKDLANALWDDPTGVGDLYDRFLEHVEPPLFATALGRSGNRCAPAARRLGLHRTTLRRKLDRYRLDDRDDGPAGA